MVNCFRTIAVIALLPALAGCTTCPPVAARPVTVKVPVAVPVYCNVADLPKPALPIANLGSDTSPADTVRAYAAAVVILKGAVAERDALLSGCRRPAAMALR